MLKKKIDWSTWTETMACAVNFWKHQNSENVLDNVAVKRLIVIVIYLSKTMNEIRLKF